MIEKLDRNSPILYWLMEYIEERIADDKKWDGSKEIKGFGSNIFNEGYIEKGSGLRKKLTDPTFIPTYRKQLQDLRKAALDTMKSFSDHFIEVLESHGLQPTDLKGGTKGIGSYFNKLANGDFSDKNRNKTVEDCLSAPENWSTKTSANRATIIELASNELMGLLEHAEKYSSKQHILVNSCDLYLR